MTKIFISADMEGVNGVVSPSDIILGELGYETARVLMTEEVNAVVEGCLRGGATEIFFVMHMRLHRISEWIYSTSQWS